MEERKNGPALSTWHVVNSRRVLVDPKEKGKAHKIINCPAYPRKVMPQSRRKGVCVGGGLQKTPGCVCLCVCEAVPSDELRCIAGTGLGGLRPRAGAGV